MDSKTGVAEERGGDGAGAHGFPSPPRWLLVSLAIQNLGRRKVRTGLLIASVAIASAIAFTGAVMMRSIETSMEVGFSRLGADLMVVAQDALTHITVALLTVEPTDTVVDADLLAAAHLSGIAKVAPQRVFRTTQSGQSGQAGQSGAVSGAASGVHGASVDLIGFEPARDFTILPWIAERLPRAMGPGDLILGAAQPMPLGAEVVLFGQPFRVYAKLAPTGAGTHERGYFLWSSSLLALAPAIRARTGTVPPMLVPEKVSGFLLELAPGARDLQVRFALLAKIPDIKVVTGGSLLTGIRQGLTALLGGTLALMGLMFASTAVMVGVLFSAIVSERRSEIGLLKAIGARRGQILGLTLTEAMVATGAGGVLGVILGLLMLRLFERALVFHLTQMGIPFLWLDRPGTALVALVCAGAAVLVGGFGALVPAWRASGREPYDLIRGEG